MSYYKDCASCMVQLAKIGWAWNGTVAEVARQRGISQDALLQSMHESMGHDRDKDESKRNTGKDMYIELDDIVTDREIELEQRHADLLKEFRELHIRTAYPHTFGYDGACRDCGQHFTDDSDSICGMDARPGLHEILVRHEQEQDK